MVREGQAVEERGCWEREQREAEKEKSHEATRPSGFSLAESMHEWGPGRLGEA